MTMDKDYGKPLRGEEKMKPGQQKAHDELTRAGLFDKDGAYGGMIGPAVWKLLQVHWAEGHSGYSNGIVVSIFEKLARSEPLGPLTGADDEWGEVGHAHGEPYWQNKRCSHVFKEKGGRAYDIDAVIFREPSGACFTSRDSRRYITFPYTPKREYVDVPARNPA